MIKLPATADVVVIGGGIMGVSTLYYLVANGCSNAVLIERATLGSGSTGAATGGIRAQFSDELNVRIALESIRRFQRFRDEIGTDIDFRQHGYLFLLREHEVPGFADAVRRQNELGVPSRLISPTEIKAIIPCLSLDGIVAGTFCAIDGSATPAAAVQGYADAARRRGARIFQSTEAGRLMVEGGRIVGVQTPDGVISTTQVVLAAGVWSSHLAESAGVTIPVKPEVRHVFYTSSPDDLPREIPLTIDFTTSFYFHREGQRLLMGGRETSIADLAPIALARLPTVAEIGIAGSWQGFYEMSPDHNAIVGAAAGPIGLAYATGFSGHGFQQAPVIGEHLALLALGKAPIFDLSAFGLERFAGDQLRPELNVI